MTFSTKITTFHFLLCTIKFLIHCHSAVAASPLGNSMNPNINFSQPKLWITVSAKTRSVEISWKDAQKNYGDLILITNQEPLEFRKVSEIDSRMDTVQGIFRGRYTVDIESSSRGSRIDGISDDDSYIVPIQKPFEEDAQYKNQWLCNNDSIAILTVIVPRETDGWITTTVPFDYALSRNVTLGTKCYGYWASYIDIDGKIIAKTCIKAYPMWMNEMKSAIADFRVRDLFIPGTHDSGSYRIDFNPVEKENLITKYSLTQDDDIRGQLMHGARYLDLRIGFYRSTNDKFYVNHGISRQRPLRDVLDQIIDFVTEANEIVIIDIQEFPVGFGRNLDVHRFLVHFLMSKLEDYLVDPTLSWQVSLREIWRRKKNIILSYDHPSVVSEFPNTLFSSVQQRWGDVKLLNDLENFLRRINGRDTMRLSSRPVADMAELTPDTWGVITDRYGGLRKLADIVNNRVSKLYIDELGPVANIVAVDFMRGTTIVEAALYWNSQKIITFR